MVKITTYKELSQYIEFFKKTNVPCMIIQSKGGLGKTETVKRALHDVPHEYRSGHMTVTELVRLFYEHPDGIIVIDDVDALFRNEKTFSILRGACDTSTERRVEYASPSHTVADLPKSFTVSAQVLLLVNDFPDGPAIRAFRTRAVGIDFVPGPEEVVRKLRSITEESKDVPKDEEVLGLFSRLAPVSVAPNFRAYILSALMKPQEMDWRKHLVETMGVRPDVGFMIAATEQGKSYKERSRLFASLSGKSERTYSRLLREYRGKM